MQFSDTTDYNGLIQDIDFLLFGDGSTFNSVYSLKDRTRNINIAYDEVVSELFKADPNFMWDDFTNADFPIATVDLEANQDHYTVPDASLVVHRVRIKNRDGKFVTLTPKLRRELSDTDLRATGTPSTYYKIDNAFFPIPVPDYGSSGGVELEFQRGANHFESTDTTQSPGFNPQFHQFLSVGAAMRYAVANGMKEKLSQLSAEKERIRAAIREHYERRSPDDRTRLRLAKANIKSYGL
jgi:hypothetical protein